MAIELFATACVLARTQQLLLERTEEGCTRELALCDLFVVEAGRRFRASRLGLQSAEDEIRRRVARDVRGAGGYGVEDAILPALPDDGMAGRPDTRTAPSGTVPAPDTPGTRASAHPVSRDS
jgi:hypothetical protein